MPLKSLVLAFYVGGVHLPIPRRRKLARLKISRRGGCLACGIGCTLSEDKKRAEALQPPPIWCYVVIGLTVVFVKLQEEPDTKTK